MTGPVLEHLGEMKMELGPAHETAHPWRRGEADGIVWLALDCEGTGTNTVSEAVIAALETELEALEQDTPRALVIRSAKENGFAAGADIDSFADLSDAGAAELLRRGHAVLDRLTALGCPTVAVVHGAALGAGFELALACDWRIAVDGASFGFPEVNLGLHPGLGGTFRLTGLIDPLEAMTLMLTGKTAHTGKAKSLGIADVVTEERHVRAAIDAIIDGKVDRDGPGLKARAFQVDQARRLAAQRMHRETEKKAPQEHYPAPHALIDIWEEHGDDPDKMQSAEIESFAHLLGTDTSRNLRRVFFLRQGLKENAKGKDGIHYVHVIGAGEMGAEIAAWAAIRGKRVTLGDVDLKPLGKAVKAASALCKDTHLSAVETRDVLDRLMPDPNGYGLKNADLVIEAAPEDPDLKEKIYADAGERMKKGAILASNTSSLRLADLAKGAPDPSCFAGLHFFNPVSKMQLVEVVRHDSTDPDVAERLSAFCGTLDRLPVPVSDYPGFLVNRALTPYLMEAMVLIDEGVSQEVIDTAAMRFGMPMGPVALADQVGLDICLHVAESLKGALDKPMPEISPRLRGKVEAGQTGKKAGQGFYDWSKGTPRPDSEDSGPGDLTDRLILPMLDACMECLRKNVARNADEVDGAMIFATGFAPFRGGPMHYAEARGHDDIRTALQALADRHGDRFAPDPGWTDD
ncbi:3-hydroxyacyl-CoA dehydrogenase NAD-binding domain-containing protein [Marivita sp.]|uniref:3-hydroxyacyl-CoA dehydrogenase NAD-binding domain-containing protein n=1 Tax=Marivita sp. TaxID=2003365 RepID=UPI0025BC9C31|nr:3-hydroxyacyl-CoA dehydrogenase NAD-binding domain-containing protein [Marivita sp.]